MKLAYTSVIFFLLFSCSKNNSASSVRELNGEVIEELVECSSSLGHPYIIKYTDFNNNVDSFMTLSLPENFKIPGTKISFKISSFIEESVFCTTDIIAPPQLPIFDVKNQ